MVVSVAPGVVFVQGGGLIDVRPDARGDRVRLQPLVAVADQAEPAPRGDVLGIGLLGEAERLGLRRPVGYGGRQTYAEQNGGDHREGSHV
jgi:hypothetical protein